MERQAGPWSAGFPAKVGELPGFRTSRSCGDNGRNGLDSAPGRAVSTVFQDDTLLCEQVADAV